MATLGWLVFRVGGLTASDLLFFASLAGAVAWMVTTRTRPPTVPASLAIAVGLFAIGGLLSTFVAVSATDSLGTLVRFCYVTLVWMWFSQVVLTSRGAVDSAIWALVFSLSVSAAVALAQSATGSSLIPGSHYELGRASGLMAHPDDLGSALAVGFVPALYLATSRRGWTSAAAAGMSVLIIAGLVVSQSNGGLLAALGATLVWLIWARPISLAVAVRLLTVVGLLAAGGMAVSVSLPNPLDRLEQATSSSNPQLDTFSSRVELVQFGLARVAEDPFIGVGLGNRNGLTEGETSTGLYIHNFFVASWYQGGVLTYIAAILLVLSIGTIAVRTVRAAPTEADRSVAIALGCGCVALFIVCLSVPVVFQRYGWVAPVLLVSLATITNRRAVRSANPPRGTRTTPQQYPTAQARVVP